MTDEEKLAEKIICSKCSNDINRSYTSCPTCSRCDDFINGFEQGYEQGKNNERKLQCGKKNYEKDIARLEKENEELKALILQWHDLRENPNDLPTKEDITIRCVLSNGNEVICKTDWYEPAEDEIGYGKIIIQFYCNDDWIDTNDVIVWCELPKFEELI